MKKVVVEVRDDASRPEGGFAVVVLRGVETVPDRVVFRLKPVEARGHAGEAGSDWPSGDLRPLAVRAGESGVELVIGPDIVDCPALVPGTLGVIEVKAAGLRGEFLWPSLRPTARPRRRTLTVVKPPPRHAASAGAASTKRFDAPLAASALSAMDGAGSVRVAAATSPALAPVAESRSAHGAAREATEVTVTALDHATPASASIAEAVGGNVVSFNVARESMSTMTDRDGAMARSASVSGRDDVDRLEPRQPPRWPMVSVRATGIAAAAAVIVSGGFLLIGQPRLADRHAVGQLSEWRDNVAFAAPAEPVVIASQPAPHPRREEPVIEAVAPAATATAASQATPVEPTPVSDASPAAAPRQSAPVLLRMRGGGFQIAGELKGFDGTKYLIETPAGGLMTLDAARFECDGEACGRPAAAILPLSERPSPTKPDQFRIEGAPALTAAFAPQLIRDYAASIGATARELARDGAASDAVRYRVADQRGVELATIDVVASGSAPGLASLERGTAAIALIDRPNAVEAETRPPSPARGRQGSAAQTPANPTEIVVGLDGIAVVAAPTTAPGALTLDHIAKIFAGQITDWFELGLPTGPIQVYLPPDGSGTLDTFVRQVMRPRNLDVTRNARRLAGDAEAAEAVTRDPRGIALTSFAEQRGAKAINLETTCGLIIKPTPFAVKAGEYPLVRRLSLQLPPQLAHPSARGIVRIAQSGEVQNAIAAARLIDPAIAMLPIEDQAERMAWAANAPAASFDANELRQMLADLTGATRLSVTFRFVPGTNELDQRSRREIARLAAALKEPEVAGRRILLAGFTDATGKLQANMSAAIKRSTQVRTALIQAAGAGLDPRLVTAKGYGPLAPIACAGTPDSVRVNRRVEVWVGARDARTTAR